MFKRVSIGRRGLPMAMPDCKNRGNIMIICLVFLFTMAVISISSLSDVTTQERRASNSNAKNQAEHAALSAVTRFLSDVRAGNDTAIERIVEAVEAGIGGQVGPFDTSVPSETHEAEVFVRLIETPSDPQNSQDADQTNQGIGTVYLEVIAQGYNTQNPDARVVIRRGFAYQ